MARYRKIDPRIWNDEKFRELPDASKLMFFMLLTHPNMTALGAMRATLPGLAAEIGWSPEAFRQAFEEASRKGMAEHDERACLVALPRFLKYNPPESPNVVKAWGAAVDLLPECKLKTLVLQRAQAFAEGMTEAFAKAFREAFPKGMANQEQEQEQEQKESPPIPPASAGGTQKRSRKKGDGITFVAFVQACRASGDKPLPRDHAVFTFATDAGIPVEFLELAWREFARQYRPTKKTQAGVSGWRLKFENCVRRNWYKLWWFPQEGSCELTTAGVQLKREREAEEAEKAEKVEKAKQGDGGDGGQTEQAA